MRAVVTRRFGGPEVLSVEQLPLPEAGVGQVRVRVAASTVSKIDLSARAGRLLEAGLMAPQPVVGYGWDVAGHVDSVGPGVRRFAVGDAVVGLRDLLFAGGAHAEHVALDESALAPAPASVSLEAAATLPLNALTADRSLQLAGLSRGQTVLVTGAAGGVGGFALQLAKPRGIRTIAAVPAGDVEEAARLGADQVVVTSDDLAGDVRRAIPGGVDAVIDAAVLGIAAHNALRGGGTFVALVAPFAPPSIRGTRVVVQEVAADGERLAELAALVDSGVLTLRVGTVLPLEAADEAHRLVAAGGLRGRVVLRP